MSGYKHSSYYIRNSQSPALIRARKPYLVKNAVVGLSLAALVTGIYVYTIRVIGQEEFEDVKVPDLPATDPQKTIPSVKQ